MGFVSVTTATTNHLPNSVSVCFFFVFFKEFSATRKQFYYSVLINKILRTVKLMKILKTASCSHMYSTPGAQKFLKALPLSPCKVSKLDLLPPLANILCLTHRMELIFYLNSVFLPKWLTATFTEKKLWPTHTTCLTLHEF